jgi:hypothetical protein
MRKKKLFSVPKIKSTNTDTIERKSVYIGPENKCLDSIREENINSITVKDWHCLHENY